MKEKVTVKEMIDTFLDGTLYELQGAKTCKKLCNNWNKTDKIELYLDFNCVGVSPNIKESRNSITKQVETMQPIITVWVSGQ